MRTMLVAGLALVLMTLALGLQFEKRPPEEQTFIREVLPNMENAKLVLFRIFNKDSINTEWLYSVDKALDNPERTDPRPAPTCDITKAPTDQFQNCRTNVSNAEAMEAATHASVIAVIAEMAESRKQWLSNGQDKYTGMPKDWKQTRHILAIHCEKPDDPFFTSRPQNFAGMAYHLENMAVALHPKYQQSILAHIENGEYDGRKIHPRGVHPDCKLEAE